MRLRNTSVKSFLHCTNHLTDYYSFCTATRGCYDAPVGRPPKAADERRSAKDQITVRLSAKERGALERLAVELRTTPGEVVRRALAELYRSIFKSRSRTRDQ
jgi:hypothetical protein